MAGQSPETGADPASMVEVGDPTKVGMENIPPDPETGKGLLKPIPDTTAIEKLAAFAALAAVASAVVAMVADGTLLVLIGGVLSIIVGPYAYYQQTLLTDIRTLTETREAIQKEVDRLVAENKRLAKNVDEMTSSIDHMEDIDAALEAITKTQGQSVDAFEKQVAESKSILGKMQGNLKANVLQNLLSIILRSDTDGDFVVDEEEIDDMVHRIKQISHVRVHEDRFRKAFAGKSVQAVMDVVRNLLKDDLPESDRIFELEQ